jgi:predicted nucleic acid-binding protein
VSLWWFPDNTVLCNFAAVARLDVLERTLANQGRWVEAVAHEARRSANVLPALKEVFRDGWLGEPIEIDGEDEVLRVDVIRRAVFGGPGAEPLKHLGEAQTLYLLQNRDEFRGSVWVTDDREAYEYAKRQGLIAKDTVAILCHAIADAIVTNEEAFGLLQAMLSANRVLHDPPSRAVDLLR